MNKKYYFGMKLLSENKPKEDICLLLNTLYLKYDGDASVIVGEWNDHDITTLNIDDLVKLKKYINKIITLRITKV